MKYLLNILFVFFVSAVAAQQHTKATITNVRFDYDLQNDNVVFSFQLSGTKPDEIFTITLEGIKVLSGERLNINSLSGDTGKISSDGIKTIIWHQRKDGYVLDEEIGIKVNAYVKPEIPMYKHLLCSAVVPGLGDYRIRNGWYHITYGVASYGLIASSVYLNFLAADNYNNYKSSFEINESDQLFKQSVKQQQLSYLVAGVAAVIWVADITGVFLKSKKLKKEITAENSRYYYTLSQQPITGIASSKQLNTKNPYERAMEKGEKLFKEQKYPEALNEFEQAVKIYPDDEKVKSKIAETIKIITEINAKEDLFRQFAIVGDSLFQIKAYYEAKTSYKNALKIKPENKIVTNKITEIDNILYDLHIDSLYSEKIMTAEAVLSKAKKNCRMDFTLCKKEYEEAKKIFSEASQINSWEEYPRNKIVEIDSTLAAIAKKKIDDEYNAIIKQADVAFQNKQYENASELYYKAAFIKKSNIDYPYKQVDKIDSILSEIEQKKKDKEYKGLISKADMDFNNGLYNKAKTKYEDAQKLRPNEDYPRKKIIAINNKLTDDDNNKSNLTKLYKKNKNAVFLIYTADNNSASQGSGFFITSDGIAVSNYHVYNGYDKAELYTEGDKKYKIEQILDADNVKDYIVFKVVNNNNTIFDYVKIAKNKSEIGEDVFTIGNPDGLEKTLSKGIVSGYREDSKYIQTDTPITHGSSGGPLFNMKGEVIGITSLGKQEGSLFFAINIKELDLGRFTK